MRALVAIGLGLTAGGCGFVMERVLFGDEGEGGPEGPPATLRIVDGESDGVSGLDVVFHRGDGSVIAHRETDGNGEAMAVVGSGAIATAFLNYGGFKGLESFGGIAPGDHVTDLRYLGPGTSLLVDVPAAYPPATTVVAVQASCIQTFVAPGADPTLTLPDLCTSLDATVATSAEAIDNVNFLRLAYATGSPAGGTAVLSPWGNSWETFTVTASGLPTDADFLEIESVALSGRWIGSAFSYDSAVPAPSIVSTQYRYPGFGTGTLAIVTARLANGVQTLSRRTAGLPPNVAIDFSSALPRLTGLAVDTTDPSRPLLTWTFAGPTNDALLFEVLLNWERGSDTYYWFVGLPPEVASQGSYQFPDLPEALSEWRPGSLTYAQAALFDRSDYADYREHLQSGVERFFGPGPESTVRLSLSALDLGPAVAPGKSRTYLDGTILKGLPRSR